jgi:hypothetical protein
VTAELNIHLEDHFPQKLSEISFINPQSMERLQLLRLITESNAQIRKQWFQDHKTLTSDKWKFMH